MKPSSVNLLRAQRRVAGICIFCAGALGRGKTECDACLDRRSARAKTYQPRRNQRYHARVALGLCGACGREAMPNRSFCGKCSEDRVDIITGCRIRKAVRHECVCCPAPAVPGKRACQKHLDAHRARTRRYRLGVRAGGRVLRRVA